MSLGDNDKISKGNSDDSDLDDDDDDENVPPVSSITQRPHLIVVPASVLNNWMREFQKFAPNMKGEYLFQCCFYLRWVLFLMICILSFSFEISW